MTQAFVVIYCDVLAQHEYVIMTFLPKTSNDEWRLVLIPRSPHLPALISNLIVKIMKLRSGHCVNYEVAITLKDTATM